MNKDDIVSKVVSKMKATAQTKEMSGNSTKPSRNSVEPTKKNIELIADLIFETIKNETANGEKVHIAEFGTFEAKTRTAREFKNPLTQEITTIQEIRKPKFKPAKAFSNAVKDA